METPVSTLAAQLEAIANWQADQICHETDTAKLLRASANQLRSLSADLVAQTQAIADVHKLIPESIDPTLGIRCRMQKMVVLVEECRQVEFFKSNRDYWKGRAEQAEAKLDIKALPEMPLPPKCDSCGCHHEGMCPPHEVR